MPNEFLPSLLHQLSGNRLGGLLERLQRDAMENDGADEIGNRQHGDFGRRGELPDDAVEANVRNESAYYGNRADDGARLHQRNGDPGTTAPQGNGEETLDLPLSQLESLARNFSAATKAGDPAALWRGDAQHAGGADPTLRAGQLQAVDGVRNTDASSLHTGIANATSSQQAAPAAGPATTVPGTPLHVIAPQNAAQVALLERNLSSAQAPTLPPSRPVDATSAGMIQRVDAAQVPPADRLSAAPLQLPGQAVPMIAGRVDVVPLPLTPQIAGATMLANGQVSNLSGPLGISAREGISSPMRDATLGIAAGHTAEGKLRQRQLRRNADRRAWLEALLPGRRRMAMRDGTPEGAGTPAFQWLFWLLAMVAYAAIAVAIVTLVPSGGDFIDITGRPSFGGISLVAGVGLAIVAWAVARRLIRK